jgi:hypothetical protein
MANKMFRIGILLCCIIVTIAFVFQTVHSHNQWKNIRRELWSMERDLEKIASELRSISLEIR